jgi:glutamyl-tRNA synthetase
MSVITRIAPSPTGYLHFGLARTALYNFLLARKARGEFVLRIEDTDTARNRPEYEEDIREQLEWLGLLPDRVYRQSDNAPRHRELLSKLIAEGTAYVSPEPAREDPSRTIEVIRLRNRGETVEFEDGIRGLISFDTTELKDFVIARTIDEPLFHFAVVVDDSDEGITHVIRGDDHISNTPRQILIQRALGVETPRYTHLPLILMPDKSKMSKRKHETSVKHYRESGVLAGALLNYIAHLGWTPPSGREILSLGEMVEEFELKQLHKSGAVFDVDKLRWYNREYLSRLDEATFASHALERLHMALAARAVPFDEGIARKIQGMLRERVSVWSDIDHMAEEGEFDFFFRRPQPSRDELPGRGNDAATASRHLAKVHEILSGADSEMYSSHERLKDTVWDYATAEGRGAVLWPMRYALSGKSKSPDPFTIAAAIGREETLARLKAAQTILGS